MSLEAETPYRFGTQRLYRGALGSSRTAKPLVVPLEMHKVKSYESIWGVLAGPTFDRSVMSFNKANATYKIDYTKVESTIPRAQFSMFLSIRPQGSLSQRQIYSSLDFIKDFGGTLFIIELVIGYFV